MTRGRRVKYEKKEGEGMEYELREWRLSDAADLAAALNDRRILDNLRDGLPYPYTEKDAEEYITAMLTADKNEVPAPLPSTAARREA